MLAPVKTTILNNIEVKEDDALYISGGPVIFLLRTIAQISFTVYSKTNNVYYNLIVDSNKKEDTIEKILKTKCKIKDCFTLSYLFENVFYCFFIFHRIITNIFI